MFILNFLLEHGGIKRVDKFLNGYYGFYERLSQDKKQVFISDYLKNDFDITNLLPFNVFRYIKGLDNLELVDEMLNSAKYFDTMPSEYASDAINSLKKYALTIDAKEFLQGLFNRIPSKHDFLKFNFGDFRDFEIKDLIEAILRFKNISFVNSQLYNLNPEQKEELDRSIGAYFRASELVEYCIYDMDFNIDNFGTIFAKQLRENQEEAVNAILEIVLDKQITREYAMKCNVVNKYDIKSRLKFVEESSNPYYFYASFAKHVQEDKHFTEGDKELLALKIKESNDYNLMFYWVIYTKCGFNYLLVDEILKEGDEYSLLQFFFLLDLECLESAIRKFNKSDKHKKQAFIREMSFAANRDNIERIDSILSIMLYGNPGVTLKKEECISLMGAGSNYFRHFIDLYEYDDAERRSILARLEKYQLYDVIAVYGAYLISGDTSKLLDDVMIGNNIKLNLTKKV